MSADKLHPVYLKESEIDYLFDYLFDSILEIKDRMEILDSKSEAFTISSLERKVDTLLVIANKLKY